MAVPIFKGFSTKDLLNRKSLRISNLDLVKSDLLNHIYTIKGERVMMPGFGTRIPMLTFEQNDETLRAIIQEDLLEVFNYDPRVELLNLTIVSDPDNNSIVATADLRYIQFDVVDTLKIEVSAQ